MSKDISQYSLGILLDDDVAAKFFLLLLLYFVYFYKCIFSPELIFIINRVMCGREDGYGLVCVCWFAQPVWCVKGST